MRLQLVIPPPSFALELATTLLYLSLIHSTQRMHVRIFSDCSSYLRMTTIVHGFILSARFTVVLHLLCSTSFSSAQCPLTCRASSTLCSQCDPKCCSSWNETLFQTDLISSIWSSLETPHTATGESTPTASILTATRREFEREGFFILPNLMSTAEVVTSADQIHSQITVCVSTNHRSPRYMLAYSYSEPHLPAAGR